MLVMRGVELVTTSERGHVAALDAVGLGAPRPLRCPHSCEGCRGTVRAVQAVVACRSSRRRPVRLVARAVHGSAARRRGHRGCLEAHRLVTVAVGGSEIAVAICLQWTSVDVDVSMHDDRARSFEIGVGLGAGSRSGWPRFDSVVLSRLARSSGRRVSV